MPAKVRSPVSPFITDIDQRLCDTVTFYMLGSTWGKIDTDGTLLKDFSQDTRLKVDFQFPPKVTSDSRRGTWDEPELRGSEPISNYTTSGAREISMSWTYIVEDRAEKGSGWTVQKIAQNIRNLRGYFSRVRARGDQRNLIVEFGMWAHTAMLDGGYSGSDYRATCRIKSVNVKHGPSLIVPTYGNIQTQLSSAAPSNKDLLNNTIPFIAYPLRTDVSIDLRLWTNQGSTINEDTGELLYKGDKVTDIFGLRDGEKPNWY